MFRLLKTETKKNALLNGPVDSKRKIKTHKCYVLFNEWLFNRKPQGEGCLPLNNWGLFHRGKLERFLAPSLSTKTTENSYPSDYNRRSLFQEKPSPTRPLSPTHRIEWRKHNARHLFLRLAALKAFARNNVDMVIVTCDQPSLSSSTSYVLQTSNTRPPCLFILGRLHFDKRSNGHASKRKTDRYTIGKWRKLSIVHLVKQQRQMSNCMEVKQRETLYLLSTDSDT